MQPFSFGIATLFFSSVAAAWLQAQVIAPGTAGWPNTYPTWWYNAADPANGVIDATLPTLNQNNDAILNQGQLWNMADQAIKELDVVLASVGGAGFDLDIFIEDGKTPSYYSPVAIGQLKAVASKFYDRFQEIGYQLGSLGWNSAIVLNEGSEDNSPGYPWKDDVTPANLSVATIGQAKHLFSWDLRGWLNEAPVVSLQSPSDYRYYISGETISLTAEASDSDGTISLVEFLVNNSPIGSSTGPSFEFAWTSDLLGEVALVARATDNSGLSADSNSQIINLSSDIDGDLMPDAFEQLIIDASLSDSDPSNDLLTVFDVLGTNDFDGDGVSNQAEANDNSDPINNEPELDQASFNFVVVDMGAQTFPIGISDKGHILMKDDSTDPFTYKTGLFSENLRSYSSQQYDLTAINNSGSVVASRKIEDSRSDIYSTECDSRAYLKNFTELLLIDENGVKETISMPSVGNGYLEYSGNLHMVDISDGNYLYGLNGGLYNIEGRLRLLPGALHGYSNIYFTKNDGRINDAVDVSLEISMQEILDQQQSDCRDRAHAYYQWDIENCNSLYTDPTARGDCLDSSSNSLADRLEDCEQMTVSICRQVYNYEGTSIINVSLGEDGKPYGHLKKFKTFVTDKESPLNYRIAAVAADLYFHGDTSGSGVNYKVMAVNRSGTAIVDTKTEFVDLDDSVRQIGDYHEVYTYESDIYGGISIKSGESIYNIDPINAEWLSSPSTNNEPLMLRSGNNLYIQKLNADGELVSFSEGAGAFDQVDLGDLFFAYNSEGEATKNVNFKGFRVRDISENGKFIFASAFNQETRELHALVLLKVDLEIHDENGNPQLATEDNPANVPVNGDFDEEKQTNGRYVRDYEDASLGFANDSTDLKTDDLRGCVVDIPGLDDTAWQNISLKIRKKAGVIDPETDEEEAGEIRIHAIDGSNNWVEVPLDSDLAPDFYVSTGQYANYDSCWIEGIKDGPITIEVEIIVGGSTPILLEKKAMICTEKTQAEWQQEVWDDMQLLYGADLSSFNPNSTFTSNETALTNLYNYYGDTYLRDDDVYLWMGIGKLAGATVYGGLEDAEYGFLPWATDAAREFILAGILPVDDDLELILVELAANGNLEVSEIRDLQSTLMMGAQDIFLDIAWQFKAYHTSGLCAIEYAFVNGASGIPIDAWRNLADAAENGNSSVLSQSSSDFAEREQSILIAPTWDVLIAGGWADVFTYMAKNPTPGSQSFAEYFTANPKSIGTPLLYLNGALVSDFDDRWQWFTQSIFPDWLGKSKGERASLAEESVSSLSGDYRADFFDLITF